MFETSKIRMTTALLLTLGIAFMAQADETQKTFLNETEVSALLDKIETTLGDLSSLRTEFSQEKHLAIFTEPVKARGILYFAQPESVRFEITEPFHSILITNGKSVAQYENIDDKWEKLRTGGSSAIRTVTSQIAHWFQGRLRDETDAYTIKAEAGTPVRLHLTPTDSEFQKYVQRINITFNQDLSEITELQIHEPGDDYTHIRFSETMRNPIIPKELFKTSGRKPSIAEDLQKR